jgi:hypothetical protein
MTQAIEVFCPHCGRRMNRWAIPPASTWSGEYQYVCFNDACPYYVDGWAWMREQYNVTASYRYRLDPFTGDRGPLPVWSSTALRGSILTDSTEEVTHAH